jgi:hypothetical protein
MLLQLNPQIPVVTPRGKGVAIGWIDYSAEHDIMWIVFQDDTNECWTWRNKDIRAQQNFTLGRKKGELLPAVEENPQATQFKEQLSRDLKDIQRLVRARDAGERI